jgi:hypothetical protein
VDRLDAPGPPVADPVSDARAAAHAAHDEGERVPQGARGHARRALRRAGGGPRGLLTPTALDRVLPAGETLSRHSIRIAAPPKRVWIALLAADLAASPVSKALLFLRGYGRRAWRRGSSTLPERLVRFGFTKLAEEPGRELVFGLAGQFWRPAGGLRCLDDAAAFDAFAEEGCVKAAWDLCVEDLRGGMSELSTETRIQYFGAAARPKFRAYWTLVGPFSGLLRRSLLRSVARTAESGAR